LNRPAIAIADPKLFQEITLHHVYDYHKPLMSGIMQLVGDGLITAEGEQHKRQRKMMTPAFTHSNIKIINIPR
jgi:cytochrome P450